MKYIIIAVIVLGVLGFVFYPNKVNYTAPTLEVVEKEVTVEVEVNPLDEKIKQRENELEEKYTKIKSLEARRDVLQAERKRLDEEITTIQKDLSGFMTATASSR